MDAQCIAHCTLWIKDCFGGQGRLGSLSPLTSQEIGEIDRSTDILSIFIIQLPECVVPNTKYAILHAEIGLPLI